MAKLCGINLIIFSNAPLPYSLQGIAKVDSEFCRLLYKSLKMSKWQKFSESGHTILTNIYNCRYGKNCERVSLNIYRFFENCVSTDQTSIGF